MKVDLSAVDYALLRGYQILGAEARSVFGYPVSVVRPTDEKLPPFRFSATGDLHYRLPGRDRDAAGELVLPAVAKTDGFATSLANTFVGACRRMRFLVKKPGDVRVYFVRYDKYIRDNLVVSRSHSGGKKLYLLDTIIALRDALSYRYEGASVDVGLILTWNWAGLEEILLGGDCAIYRFADGSNLRTRLQQAKSSYLLADGVTSFYVSTPEARIDRLVVLPNRVMHVGNPEWQLVPREYRYIQPLVHGHEAFLIANRRGELWFFTKDAALKWVGNGWHRVSAPSLTGILEQHLLPVSASRLAEVVLALSVRRMGALLVIGPNLDKLSEGASGGIRQQFEAGWSPNVCDMSVEFLTSIAGIDGATLISPDGSIANAGVILRVPQEHRSAGEGARTAAASYAGHFGLAIKVSHDGPVSVYDQNGLRLQVS